MKRKKKKETKEDDFFRNEEEETEEDHNPEDQLVEDLKVFKDDLKKSKKKVSEEEGEKTESEEEIDFTGIEEKESEEEEKESEEEEKESDRKWLIKKRGSSVIDDEEEGWLDKDYEEGELAVDVYQDKNNVYVKSTIAGVNVEDIDISIHNDLLTIRGKREQSKEEKGVDYFYQECYWGSFSRSIILPVEVKADKIEAFLKDGILTIVLPKIKKEKKPKIKVKEK